MQYPISMSVIVVQLGEDDNPHAYVTFSSQVEGATKYSMEYCLDEVSDATDIEMWAQMVAARVCDVL
jgi:hypothetical protein